jgi:hypothetical protein
MDCLEFKYKFRSDYNPVYINGAYGGVSPRGELIVSFYLERAPVPNCEKRELIATPEGIKVGEIPIMEPTNYDHTLVRFVEAGIVMNLDTAESVANWILEKVRQQRDQIQES